MTVQQENSTVSRRRVAQGAAWAVPVIAVSAAAPKAAATCGPWSLPLFSTWTITSTGTTPGGCAGGSPLDVSTSASGHKAWLWCDSPIDPAGPATVAPYTVTACTTFRATANTTYVFSFTAEANEGTETTGPDVSYPANVVMTINGTQTWAGYTVGSADGGNAHSGDVGITTTNKVRLPTSNGSTNYTPVAATATYVNTGAARDVTICYTWTVFIRPGGTASDDIGIKQATVSCP